MGKYDAIMDMKRPADPDYPPMSMHNRAAQFAPFDALTGLGGRIYEASRLTEERIELDESAKLEINEKLLYLQEHIKECPEVTVTYFVPDRSKDGGAYLTACGRVLRINEYDECLVLAPELSIQFDDILGVDVIDSKQSRLFDDE